MTNPIILNLDTLSATTGTVAAFSDATIVIMSFTVDDAQPVLKACREILKQTVLAKPYKLKVNQGSAHLFTVRSINWGCRRTIDEMLPDYALIDNQYIGPSTQV